jgi:arylsulfatase
VGWPGGLPGEKYRISHEKGHLIDIMATCVEVAGASYPAKFRGQEIIPMEGKSLLPLLRGEHRESHPALFWEHEGNRAVRQGNWKLVSRYRQPWELYDMSADRSELVDLSEKQPEQVRNMAALYDDWAARAFVVPWEKTGK